MRIKSPTIHRPRALTILEMLVSTAMLAVIIVGLTAMFIQTQKAFKAGIRQTDFTDSGTAVLDLIGGDLAELSDAKTPGITNLYWSWSSTNFLVQYVDDAPVRTNQLEEIFVLVQTNSQWLGIGYAVSNSAPGVGTLYRYVAAYTNGPISLTTNNSLFNGFYLGVAGQTFGPAFHRVADGVIHLKIRAFDQYGNENGYEQGLDYASAKPYYEFTYPLSSNTLPNSIQLEVGVLEDETYAQAKSFFGNPTAQGNFLAKAANHVHVFRENIPIAEAVR